MGLTAETRRTDTRLVTLTPVSSAQYGAWDRYGLPATEEIAPDTWAIALPTGGGSGQYVYCYRLRTAQGDILIDCGMDRQEGLERLTRELAGCGGGIEDVTTVLCTHYHRDHFGNASALHRRFGIPVAMHAIDANVIVRLSRDMGELQESLWNLMGVRDVDEEARRRAGNPFFDLDTIAPGRTIADGEVLDFGDRRLRAIWTPGHSPGHLCFLESERGTLFSGDLVLPLITTGVSVQPIQRANPLGDFLASLKRLEGLDVQRVLPGHEFAFVELGARIGQLRQHHNRRLAEILEAVGRSPELDCAALSAMLTWSRPWSQMQGRYARMACGETLAHLVLLEECGLLVRVDDRPARWVVATPPPS